MAPEKQVAINAIKAGYTYDVNGHPCRTVADVNAAWKDPHDPGDPPPEAHESKPVKMPKAEKGGG